MDRPTGTISTAAQAMAALRSGQDVRHDGRDAHGITAGNLDPLRAQLRSDFAGNFMAPKVRTTSDELHGAWTDETYKDHHFVLVERSKAPQIWPTLNRRGQVAVVVDGPGQAEQLAKELTANDPFKPDDMPPRQISYATSSLSKTWTDARDADAMRKLVEGRVRTASRVAPTPGT